MIAIGIEAARIKDISKDTVMKWFNDVRRVFDKTSI